MLEKATRAFWMHGYEATSISDLVARTGLHRGSLYAAFDGKRGLYLACLDYYDRRHRHDFLAAVEADNGPRDAIVAVFEAAARRDGEANQPPGCLMVNSALEVSPHDPEVRAVVAQSLSRVEKFFHDKLTAAQADGSVPPGIDATQAAKALLGLFLGLRVLVRSEMGDAATTAVIDQARAVLVWTGPPPNTGRKP